MDLQAMDVTGAAVAQAGERRLLVPGGIPGETVRVKMSRVFGRSTIADLLEVVRPSPHRVTPRCRHAAVCGGCGWQHVAYAEQLRLKTDLVQRLLREALGDRAPAVAPMIGMPVGGDGMPWGFRQKAAFVFGAGEGGKLTMGHFARATTDVVPVVECPVHAEPANRAAFALRDELVRSRITAAGPNNRGLARHVVVRTTGDGNETVAMLVATRDEARLEEPLTRFARSRLQLDGVLLNLHNRPGPYLVGGETIRVAGIGHVREERLGKSFLVSPTAFFQTNVEAAAVLLRLVREALPGDRLRILDLYSGGGLFAVPLAADGHTVTAVEDSRKASRDAALNLKINEVPAERLRTVCSKVEVAARHLPAGGFDAVILDPPRSGTPPAIVREVFSRLRPARGVLVSCNPEALARELKEACAAGYRIERVQPVDMFPHTPHVETVAVLAASTAPAPPPRRPAPRRTAGLRPRGHPRR